MMRLFRSSFLLLALALLCSCAKGPGPSPSPSISPRSAETWDRFITTASRTENIAGPFRLNATLYYSGKEDSQRVTVYFWGNGNKVITLPLRLDILMGPGSVMAAAREDARGLFIYVPNDKLVYHAGEDGLLAFGMPVPFTLADLGALVTGRFAAVFAPADGTAPSGTQARDGDPLEYTITDAPLPGVVALSPLGLPVAWTDEEQNWKLDIDYWPDSTRPTPRKLYIRNRDGREATLIVRELTAPGEAFTTKQLELTVPPNTRLAPLEIAQ